MKLSFLRSPFQILWQIRNHVSPLKSLRFFSEANICAMPTFILDLPTELLLKIIHSEDNATIACFGQTCRRLHDICQVLVMKIQLAILRTLMRERQLVIFKDLGSATMKGEELHDVHDIFKASFDKIEYKFLSEFTPQEIGSVHALILRAYAVADISISVYSWEYFLNWWKPLAIIIRASSKCPSPPPL